MCNSAEHSAGGKAGEISNINLKSRQNNLRNVLISCSTLPNLNDTGQLSNFFNCLTHGVEF